jgi:hypothetical protein
MILLFAAASIVDFDALDKAVETCSRKEATPFFADEFERRNQFLTSAFKEQEAIIADRLDIAARRRALREAGVASLKGGDSEKELTLRSAANDDRQRALNDSRMLEGMRNDAMDAKRRYFLAHCATTGKD